MNHGDIVYDKQTAGPSRVSERSTTAEQVITSKPKSSEDLVTTHDQRICLDLYTNYHQRVNVQQRECMLKTEKQHGKQNVLKNVTVHKDDK